MRTSPKYFSVDTAKLICLDDISCGMGTKIRQDSTPKTVNGKEIFGISVMSYKNIRDNISFDKLHPEDWPAQDKIKTGSIFTIDPEIRDDTLGSYDHPLESDVFWSPIGLDHPSVKRIQGTGFWVGIGVYSPTTIVGRYDSANRNIVLQIFRGIRKRNPSAEENNPSVLRISDAQFRVIPDPKIAFILGEESRYLADKL